MPLKAEEQPSIQDKTQLSVETNKTDAINNNNSNNNDTQNLKPGDHTEGAKINSLSVDQSISDNLDVKSNNLNNINCHNNESDAIHSDVVNHESHEKSDMDFDLPPAKRPRCSIQASEDEDDELTSTIPKDEPMIVEEEEEEPKYDELHQVGRDPSEFTTAIVKTEHNVRQHQLSETNLLTSIREDSSVESNQNASNIITLRVAEPSDTVPMDDFCPDGKPTAQEANFELEDFDSVARVVTDQIVTNVSRNFSEADNVAPTQ